MKLYKLDNGRIEHRVYIIGSHSRITGRKTRMVSGHLVNYAIRQRYEAGC